MSVYQVDSVQDAEQALCENRLFQVGGELIDPDDVIKATLNSGVPTFTLVDGSTVAHDEFERGDVGDLLWQALPAARRVDNQSETILPKYNRIFQVDQANDEINLLARDESIITQFDTPNARSAEAERHNGEVFDPAHSRVYRLGEFYHVHAFDLDGTRLWEDDTKNHTDGTALAVMPNGEILVHRWDTGSNGASIRHIAQDGTQVSINESTTTLWGDSGSPPAPPQTGLVGDKSVGTDGFAVFCETGDLERVPLDGTTDRTTNFGLSIGTNQWLGYHNGYVYFHAGNSGIRRVPIDNANATPETVVDLDASTYDVAGVRRVNSNRIVIAGNYHSGDGDDGGIIYDRNEDKVLHAFSDRTYWDGYTDKSVL